MYLERPFTGGRNIEEAHYTRRKRIGVFFDNAKDRNRQNRASISIKASIKFIIHKTKQKHYLNSTQNNSVNNEKFILKHHHHGKVYNVV